MTGSSTTRLALTATAMLGLAMASCSYKVPRYCDEDTFCEDPEYPFCDLLGEYAASEGIGRTCIPYPWDAAVNDGGMTDSGSDAAGDAGVPPSIVITPDTYDFGQVTEGNLSALVTFEVSNTADESTGVLAVSVSSTSEFAIVTDYCNGNVLAPAASCNIEVRFQPQSAGAKSATLDVEATPGGSVQAILDGTGLAAGDLTISPTIWDFGAIVEGSSSSPRTFVVENTGSSPTGTISTTLVDTTNYSILVDNCDGVSLAASAECTIEARFEPTTSGGLNTTLSVSATPGDTAATSLSGTGLALGELSISPTTWDFGSVTEGTTSSSKTFVVENIGELPTGTITTTLADTINYSILADNCNAVSLAAGEQCTIDARFEPASAGDIDTALSASASPGGETTASLSGTGLEPGELTISPTSPDFGSVAVGSTSSSQEFIVENTGESPTGTISTSLVDTTNYTILADNCGGTSLAPSTQCTIEARFEPTIAGDLATTLTASATPGGAAPASLSGTGTAKLSVLAQGDGTVTSTPAGIDCGSTCSYTFSTATVTLHATADDTSTFTGWSLGGCPGTGSCLVTLDGDKNVTATFVQNQLAITSVSTREGHYGNTIFAFDVTLTPASSKTVTVNYATTDGTATIVDQDYLTATGVTTFAPGDTSEAIEVTVLADKKSEPDEVFTVTLSGPTSAVIATSEATGTIEDDDRGFDLDDDGFADLVVGAYLADDGGTDAGAVYIFLGSTTPTESLDASDADVVLIGEDATDWFGRAVTTGDVNGDGRDDLLVGARYDDDGGAQAGAVYVFYGPLTGPVDASAADVKLIGEAAGDNFGFDIASANVNGDGLADILVGANGDDDGGSGSGCAFVFYGSSSLPATIDASAAAAKLVGEAASDGFGLSIASAGDFNGDGLEDVIVGAPGKSTQTGTAYVFFGAASWSDATIDASAADVTITGGAPENHLGWSVGGAVDVNGDKKDDVVIGAFGVEYDGGGYDGAGYIFFGAAYSSPQSLSASDADFTLLGVSNTDLGWNVDGIGDINGDGFGDFVIGERLDGQVANNAGQAHVVLGSATLGGTHLEGDGTDIKIGGEGENDYFGICSSVGFDFNRDGYHDFAVGAERAGPSEEGRAYLFLGGDPLALPSGAGSAASVMTGAAAGDRFGQGLQ